MEEQLINQRDKSFENVDEKKKERERKRETGKKRMLE